MKKRITTVTDNNYPSIESFADATGGFNTALVKSKGFKSLRAYMRLLDETSELDVFDGIKLKHRFEYYSGGMVLSRCATCGAPFVYFPRSQKRFSKCRHHQIDGNVFGEILRRARDGGRASFITGLNDDRMRLSDNEYMEKLAELTAKPRNYAYIITKKEYSEFYHDLVLRTRDILPVSDDLMISRRLYIEQHGMKSEPLCQYCGKNPVVFINRIAGYNDSCNECSKTKSDITRGHNTKDVIDNVFDFSKYDILSYPALVNKEPLVIRCKSCGKITELIINNGMISTLGNGGLCRHCEYRSGWEETDFYNFLKSIYSGEIIHGCGGRKIIPPYELDNYLQDVKIAFEYDGVYWHSDFNGKDRNYHVTKTDMCNKLGIKLIHVFSSEWNNNRKVVEGVIKGMLGRFDRMINAGECDVRTVLSSESRRFQIENHIQGAERATVHLGLYYGTELVSVMTFSKLRAVDQCEWELVRFCDKLGCRIDGSVPKMFKHFEFAYKPKSVISRADRRWSNGDIYEVLGFNLKGIDKPDYWYFSNHSDKLFSKFKFQKHKLKSMFVNFDESKTEYENMAANGYLRIFDCGSLVFVKRY